ncbi:MAG: DUF1127 domain-containing protein [Hyphomicrobiaceae bacterium]
MHLWRERCRSRRELALLDESALKDIGLSRYERCQESCKWFWMQ